MLANRRIIHPPPSPVKNVTRSQQNRQSSFDVNQRQMSIRNLNTNPPYKRPWTILLSWRVQFSTSSFKNLFQFLLEYRIFNQLNSISRNQLYMFLCLDSHWQAKRCQGNERCKESDVRAWRHERGWRGVDCWRHRKCCLIGWFVEWGMNSNLASCQLVFVITSN